MKSTFIVLAAVISVGMAGLFSGCYQGAETSGVAMNSAAGQATDEACCPSCQPNNEADANKDCYGKCGEQLAEALPPCCLSGKTATNSPARQGNQPAGCSEDCNECANGSSEYCKCDETGTVNDSDPAQVKSTDKDEVAHVNSMREDRDIFHFLLANHRKITRKVTELENGVKTVTESADPEITRKLQNHVASMHRRIVDGRPLRMWDDLYREIFKHHDKIDMKVSATKNGISVVETSKDEYVVQLIKEHAKVVSGFAKRGFDEARQNHIPPKSDN